MRHRSIRKRERVQKVDDCAMECLKTSSCISLNTASFKDQESTFWCELLLSDMFNNSQNFKENATSHNFSKWVSLSVYIDFAEITRIFGKITSIFNHIINLLRIFSVTSFDLGLQFCAFNSSTHAKNEPFLKRPG